MARLEAGMRVKTSLGETVYAIKTVNRCGPVVHLVCTNEDYPTSGDFYLNHIIEADLGYSKKNSAGEPAYRLFLMPNAAPVQLSLDM